MITNDWTDILAPTKRTSFVIDRPQQYARFDLELAGVAMNFSADFSVVRDDVRISDNNVKGKMVYKLKSKIRLSKIICFMNFNEERR